LAAALGGTSLAEAAGAGTTPPPVVPPNAVASPSLITHGSSSSSAPADEVPVVCDTNEGDPHKSTHNPGRVNFVVKNECNQVVYDVHMRAALFFNGVLVDDTGSKPVGNRRKATIKANVPCRPGTYQGWGGASWTNPPNIWPPTEGAFGWSRPREVTC
jgi:hypothetical protein